MTFKDRLRAVLQVRDTPHCIAMSFAVGVFWGMSPLLGIHALGAFFVAWLFGLNRFVAVVGVFVTNPWTIVPIYSFSLWFGTKLIGVSQISTEIDWNHVTFIDLVSKLKDLILPFFVGTFVVGAVSAVISYFIIHVAVVRFRNKIKDAA